MQFSLDLICKYCIFYSSSILKDTYSNDIYPPRFYINIQRFKLFNSTLIDSPLFLISNAVEFNADYIKLDNCSIIATDSNTYPLITTNVYQIEKFKMSNILIYKNSIFEQVIPQLSVIESELSNYINNFELKNISVNSLNYMSLFIFSLNTYPLNLTNITFNNINS